MQDLTIKPIIQDIEGGWQAYGHVYENTPMPVSSEVFNAYDNRDEAWQNANEAVKAFADKHNTTCKCGKTMTVSSY